MKNRKLNGTLYIQYCRNTNNPVPTLTELAFFYYRLKRNFYTRIISDKILVCHQTMFGESIMGEVQIIGNEIYYTYVGDGKWINSYNAKQWTLHDRDFQTFTNLLNINIKWN